jgi:hypothetical protein
MKLIKQVTSYPDAVPSYNQVTSRSYPVGEGDLSVLIVDGCANMIDHTFSWNTLAFQRHGRIEQSFVHILSVEHVVNLFER